MELAGFESQLMLIRGSACTVSQTVQMYGEGCWDTVNENNTSSRIQVVSYPSCSRVIQIKNAPETIILSRRK